jgi:flagellar motor component MotA
MGVFLMMGMNPMVLVNIPFMIAVVLAPLGSAVLAFGLKEVLETLYAFRLFLLSPTPAERSNRPAAILRYLIASTYAIGGLTFLIAVLVTIATRGSMPAQADCFWEHLAAASIALSYPVFISEGLLRPLKSRLE